MIVKKKRANGVAPKQLCERAVAAKAKTAAKAAFPQGIGKMSAIGSDEVGTGDFFGPITVVAAYVKKENIPLLQELGVRDSKDLKDEKIISIAKEIKDVVPFSLLTLKNEKYNQLQRSGMSQGKMKAILHNQAILNVLAKIAPEKPEAILIDQFVQESTYYQHVKNQKAIARENVYFSTKAEGIHLAVAAASILARYAFVQYIDKLSEAAGFRIPKGAGAHVDEAAAKLILKKGNDILPAFVKLHFANTDKAMALVHKKEKINVKQTLSMADRVCFFKNMSLASKTEKMASKLEKPASKIKNQASKV